MNCSKKKFDKKGAQSALNHNAHANRKYRHEKRMYYCKICRAWHLTKNEEAPERVEKIDLTYKEKWLQLTE